MPDTGPAHSALARAGRMLSSLDGEDCQVVADQLNVVDRE